MSRITPLSIEDAKAAAAEAGVFAQLAELNVFRALLNHPRLAKALNDVLLALLAGRHLDAKLRELVIMRIGWVTGSVYEWTSHWPIALGTGLSEADVVGVRDWRAHPAFGSAERAVLAATDETMETGTISATTWTECASHLDQQALLELVGSIGNWRLFSSLLRSLEIPVEDGTAEWPPDGVPPS